MQLAGLSNPRWALSQLTDGVFNGYISPVVLRESSNFVKLVREHNNEEVHDRFKQILKDYLIQQRSDVGGIALRIEQLVEDHTELRQGFKNLQMAVKATDFIKKIEGRLAVNDVKHYFEILKEFSTGQTSIVKMVEEMAVLFADHMDLFEEFCEFLPDSFNLSE
ncbi:hypothetical protein FH972_019048 [Carpinus fangiana]|uniref:Uncharacterized protein n=1 Tax=Carpinus fangiana TaxID=176857 RepID=A0A5N6RS88_9ROSI|nr:hypothetical protein FH972_019048 [Carpinus fangiana]